jgi:hypothetical protein
MRGEMGSSGEIGKNSKDQREKSNKEKGGFKIRRPLRVVGLDNKRGTGKRERTSISSEGIRGYENAENQRETTNNSSKAFSWGEMSEGIKNLPRSEQLRTTKPENVDGSQGGPLERSESLTSARSDAGQTPTSEWCRSISNLLKEHLISGKSVEAELEKSIKEGMSCLGLENYFQGKEPNCQIGELYVSKNVLENGDILITNKKRDERWIPVNEAMKDAEWCQSIENNQNQVKLDLKMYVIQRPDQNNKQNNSSEQEGPDILVTHDSNLVKEKIKEKGWEALPGTVTGIEISNDENKIEQRQKIEQAYDRIMANNDRTSKLLMICEKALSNIYWDAYAKKEEEREILDRGYYQKFQKHLIREEVDSDEYKPEKAVESYRENLLEKFKIYDESLKRKLPNDFNKLKSLVGENGSSTSERPGAVTSSTEVTNDLGVVGDQGSQSSTEQSGDATPRQLHTTKPEGAASTEIPPATDPSKMGDVTPPVSSSSDWIAKKTVEEALEWLASAKIAEALKERGLFKYLGYGTTDTQIETKGLRLYENNGTYYVTSGDKNFLNKYGLEDKHIVEKVDPKKFEELCNNFDKIQWDLPKIHAIRTAEKHEGSGVKNEKGEEIRRPEVLITDSEEVVRERIVKSKEKGWKAAVTWSLPAFDISSKKPTKEDRLIYKALHGEISEKTKGKRRYTDNKPLLDAIEEGIVKKVNDRNQTYRNIIKEYEKNFVELYYNSDLSTKRKLEEEFSNYRERIQGIKNEFKERTKEDNLKKKIVDYLDRVFKEAENIREQRDIEGQPDGGGEGSSKTGGGSASTSGQGDKGSEVVPEPGADNLSQTEHGERPKQLGGDEPSEDEKNQIIAQKVRDELKPHASILTEDGIEDTFKTIMGDLYASKPKPWEIYKRGQLEQDIRSRIDLLGIGKDVNGSAANGEGSAKREGVSTEPVKDNGSDASKQGSGKLGESNELSKIEKGTDDKPGGGLDKLGEGENVILKGLINQFIKLPGLENVKLEFNSGNKNVYKKESKEELCIAAEEPTEGGWRKLEQIPSDLVAKFDQGKVSVHLPDLWMTTLGDANKEDVPQVVLTARKQGEESLFIKGGFKSKEDFAEIAKLVSDKIYEDRLISKQIEWWERGGEAGNERDLKNLGGEIEILKKHFSDGKKLPEILEKAEGEYEELKKKKNKLNRIKDGEKKPASEADQTSPGQQKLTVLPIVTEGEPPLNQWLTPLEETDGADKKKREESKTESILTSASNVGDGIPMERIHEKINLRFNSDLKNKDDVKERLVQKTKEYLDLIKMQNSTEVDIENYLKEYLDMCAEDKKELAKKEYLEGSNRQRNAINDADRLIDAFLDGLDLRADQEPLEEIRLPLNGERAYQQDVSPYNMGCLLRATLVSIGHDMGEPYSRPRVEFESLVSAMRIFMRNRGTVADFYFEEMKDEKGEIVGQKPVIEPVTHNNQLNLECVWKDITTFLCEKSKICSNLAFEKYRPMPHRSGLEYCGTFPDSESNNRTIARVCLYASPGSERQSGHYRAITKMENTQ